MPVTIPPLRDRPEDISALAARFARRAAAETGKEVRGISPEALRLLQGHSWPGNVRELQHAIERAVILTTDPLLPAHVFDGLRTAADAPSRLPVPVPNVVQTNGTGSSVGHTVHLQTLNVAEAERVLIQRALAAAKQNRTRAAELLGISVRTLRNKLNVRGESTAEMAIDGSEVA
jgi:DNA-binding NtrC family response regulator